MFIDEKGNLKNPLPRKVDVPASLISRVCLTYYNDMELLCLVVNRGEINFEVEKDPDRDQWMITVESEGHAGRFDTHYIFLEPFRVVGIASECNMAEIAEQFNLRADRLLILERLNKTPNE